MTVDIIFVDANDRSQLPGNDLNIHDMKEHGNYHENFLMSDAVSFNSFLKMNFITSDDDYNLSFKRQWIVAWTA